jgi:PAS domain S-box-containing protein
MNQGTEIKVLLVEDDEDDYIIFKDILKEIKLNSYSLTWVSSYEKAREQVRRNEYDVYFFDYLLGAKTGLDLLQECVETGVDSPVIILTGLGDQQTDLKAMQLGAVDYLIKDEISVEKLERSIRYCIEQNKMLKRLKSSEAKFRSIFENSHDVIYLSDKDGKFMDINESAERLFGYSRDEMLNMTITDLYENKKECEKFIESIHQNGHYSGFEVVLLDKAGNKKYCTLTANIQRTAENRNVYYQQGIIHDMTMRKKAERDVITAEKLAIAGKIARTLAHEVRNPLTNINLSVEQLEEDITNENYKPYFDIIKRNSKRINDLVTELIENSKPAALNEALISVQTILQNTIELAKDRAELKNIKILTDFNLLNEKIVADEASITIAFLNILINAIEAVEENTGVIKISSGSEGSKCYISIEDNGHGIQDTHRSKIFEPYFTNKPNGMGLGLSASQSIISIHKGTIDFESELTKGTRFFVELNKY